MDLEKISNLKQRIVTENKNNNSSRKKYSKNLKNEIGRFVIEHKLPIRTAAQLIGVSFSSVEKWKMAAQKNNFKKISISPLRPEKKIANKIINQKELINAIKINQMVLMTLLVLWIFESIFLRLID